MNLKFSLIIIIGLLLSCSQTPRKNQVETLEVKLKKEAIAIAKNYAVKQLKESKTTVDENGIITIRDDQKRYKIDPEKIFTGLIDSDMNEDAIVSLTSYYKHDMGFTEHLILINTNGKLVLIKVIETDMKIVKLKDRIITAELHTKPKTSPLYNCPHCIEIVNYQFKDGDLVKLK
jgi:hypothetical protein